MSQMALDRARDREALLNGWVLLRFTWHDVKQRPEVVAAQVRDMIELRRAG
jgi:very-short-patch-repair endonuclease